MVTFNAQLFADGCGGWEGGRGPALFHKTLADQKAALTVPLGPGDHLVPGHAAPGGKLDFDGGVGGEDFEEAAALHRVDMTADEQEETAAAVEVTAVEAEVGLVSVTFGRVHERLGCGRSVGDGRTVVGEELYELGTTDYRCAVNEVVLV